MRSYWWSYAVGEREVVFHAHESRGAAAWKRERMKLSPLARRVGVVRRKLTPAQLREIAATNFAGLKVTVLEG